MQETHLSSNNKSYKQYHFIMFESKSRGVAIFIKNTVLFDIHIYTKTRRVGFLYFRALYRAER